MRTTDERRYQRHAKRCESEVTRMVPPSATGDQCNIEICDEGYWSVFAFGRGWCGPPEKDGTLPDEFYEAIEEAAERCREQGFDHVAGSLSRFVATVTED